MGLRPPGAVRAATDEYLRDKDAVAQFLEECCEMDAANKLVRDGDEATADLYGAFQSWAAEVGVPVGKLRWFGRQLQSKGCEPYKGTAGQRRYRGVMLTEKGRARTAAWSSRPVDQVRMDV